MFPRSSLEPTMRTERSMQPSMLGRAVALLPEFHQKLIQLRSSGRCSFRELSQVFHKSAGWLCRQYQRLKLRLQTPIAESLVDSAAMLPEQVRQIAVAHFLLGKPPKHLAIDFQLTRRQVIAILDYVRGWVARAHLHVG